MAFPRSDNTVAWRTRVHIYELDSLGHVNNANYFPYLQQATGEAWPQAARWTLKRLSMEYLAPVLVGVELAIHIWMEDFVAAGWLTLGYAVVGQADSEVRLRARLAWDTGGDPDVWTAFPAADALPGQYQLRPVRPVEELPVARRFLVESSGTRLRDRQQWPGVSRAVSALDRGSAQSRRRRGWLELPALAECRLHGRGYPA